METTAAAPLPTRRQARRLVVSLGLFWGLAGAVVLEMPGGQVPPDGVIFAVTFLPAWLSGMVAIWTLYDIWRARFGRSPLAMFFGMSREVARLRWQATIALLRPSWIRQTLRATEWPPLIVGGLLAALLVADFVLLAVMPVRSSR